MKLAYVVTRADEVGGAQIHVRDLAIALRGAGHEVTVLAGSHGPMSARLSEGGVAFEAVPSLVRPIAPRDDWAAVRQLRARLRDLRPDLVSTHSSKAGWLGRLAARTLGLPVLFTAHGWAFTEGVPQPQRWMYALAERLAAPFASHIITVSAFDRDLALAHRIAPPAKITCVPNGVHDHAVGPSQRAPGPARIMMIGRFSAQKDQGTLLRGLARLAELDWRLDLVGGGPGQAEAVALAADLGVADRVRFLGERHDVHGLLAHADIYALTSRWEGLPRSILEAMSAGLPVVATDVGGVSEVVADGETGMLVARNDPDAVARKLAELIANQERRRSMGAAGRRRYENQFRFEIMYERTLAIYRAVVTAPGTVGTTAAQSL